ncbi:MAG: class I SAM-dependent methyltransferase [Pseudomonadota bacterium]
MKRETTNKIRFILEELIPPVLRDGAVFRSFAKLAWGRHIDDLADFRKRAAFLSEDEYMDLYKKHPRVHEGTDNSDACIERIIEDVIGDSVCDVGCGTGILLKKIRQAKPNVQKLTGVDFAIDDAEALPGIEYVAAKIEDLPFEDGAFDTVICTHVIEHILDYRAAIKELRRIAKKRLIIVVPLEREYAYTFNPHFNFFPYTHSFLRAMHPVPQDFECVDILRDIYYREDCSEAVPIAMINTDTNKAA